MEVQKVYTGIPIHIVDILLDEWERLLKDGDEDDEDEENKEEEMRKIAESAKKTPLADVIAIFQDIVADYNNSKVLREKIKEDLFSDTRLVSWDILEGETQHNDSSNESEEEEEEEWKGF